MRIDASPRVDVVSLATAAPSVEPDKPKRGRRRTLARRTRDQS